MLDDGLFFFIMTLMRTKAYTTWQCQYVSTFPGPYLDFRFTFSPVYFGFANELECDGSHFGGFMAVEHDGASQHDTCRLIDIAMQDDVIVLDVDVEV